MTVSEFQAQVFEAVSHSPICDAALILEWEKSRIKIHVDLFTGGFIEAYHNQRTASTSFTLVQNGARVYGADNAGDSWHYHPVHNPSEHVSLDAPMTIEKFLIEVSNLVI